MIPVCGKFFKGIFGSEEGENKRVREMRGDRWGERAQER